MVNRHAMRHHVFDATNGTIAVSYVTAYLSGWTISEWAAAAALVYSLILILDKLVSMGRRFLAWRKERSDAI